MERKHVYTTVNGREVEYQAISLDALRLSWRGIEKEYRERGEPIDPPTYEITTAGGAKITEKHDETTDKTEAEQAAWDAHQAALSKMLYDKKMIHMQYIFEDGLESIQLPDDKAWIEKHRSRKIEIPNDTGKLREFYITKEILKTADDIAGITAAVMMLSQQGKVDEAALETALESFRNFLGRKTTKQPVDGKEQVAPFTEVSGAKVGV